VGTPLALPLWTEDDGKITTNSGALPRTLPTPVIARWSKYRGAGDVKFADERPVFAASTGGTPGAPFAGKSATTATFSEPGEYTLHLMLNDYSGDGGQGFQCCWSTGQVRVTVAK